MPTWRTGPWSRCGGTAPPTVSIPELGVTLEAFVVQVSGPLHIGSVWEIELRQAVRAGKETEDPKDYLIRKSGYYYRPNRAGYTTKVEDAGRYTKVEAEREAAVEPWHMAAVPLSSVIPIDEDPRIATVKEATAKVACGDLYADGRWECLPHLLTAAFDVLHMMAHDRTDRSTEE